MNVEKLNRYQKLDGEIELLNDEIVGGKNDIKSSIKRTEDGSIVAYRSWIGL